MMNQGRTHKVSNFGVLRPVSQCGYIRAMDVHILDTLCSDSSYQSVLFATVVGGGGGELEEDSEEQDSEYSEEQDFRRFRRTRQRKRRTNNSTDNSISQQINAFKSQSSVCVCVCV